MTFDTDFVRSRFPGLAGEWTLMDNAGGSQILAAAADRIHAFLLGTNVQLGATYAPSEEAGERVRQGRAAAATLLGAAAPDDVVIGASTTTLLQSLAASLAPSFAAGDEVVVTNVDHEANIGPWVRLQEHGVVVKWWRIRPDTHELELDDLDRLLSARTRLVAFPHASNILGSLMPVDEVIDHVHARGAMVCIDGVAHAPHRATRFAGLDADFYAVSFYKVYGPHLAALCVRPDRRDLLANRNHDFLADTFPGRLEPGNVNYELTASLPAVLDYVTELGVRAGGADVDAPEAVKIDRAFAAIAAHEEALQAPLLDFLVSHDKVRVIGRAGTDRSVRVPTVSFVVDGIDSARIPGRMELHGIGIRYGHFYAKRLIDSLDLAAQNGVVRISLVHYNTVAEVEHLVACLRGAF